MEPTRFGALRLSGVLAGLALVIVLSGASNPWGPPSSVPGRDTSGPLPAGGVPLASSTPTIVSLGSHSSGDRVASLNLTVTVSTNPVEAGSSLRLAAYGSGGIGDLSYSWAGLPVACGPPTIAWLDCVPAIGPYNISVQVTDAIGESARASLHVLVVPTLVAGATFTPTGNCTAPSSGRYSTTASGGVAPYRYLWHLTNGTVLATSNGTEFFPFPKGSPVVAYVVVQDAEGAQIVAQPYDEAYNGCQPPLPVPMPLPGPGLPSPGASPPPFGAVLAIGIGGVVLMGLVAALVVGVVEARDRRPPPTWQGGPADAWGSFR